MKNQTKKKQTSDQKSSNQTRNQRFQASHWAWIPWLFGILLSWGLPSLSSQVFQKGHGAPLSSMQGAQSVRAPSIASRLPWGGATQGLEGLFEDFFYDTEVRPGECRDNISNWVGDLKQRGLDVRGIYGVRIDLDPSQPSWTWSFGRVHAMRDRWGQAREGNFYTPWYYHVIAIDHRWGQGLVYDFSFTKTPRVLPLWDYLREMFIPNPPFALHGESFRLRGEGPLFTEELAWRELKDYYRFRVYPMEAPGDPLAPSVTPVATLTLAELLSHFGGRPEPQ